MYVYHFYWKYEKAEEMKLKQYNMYQTIFMASTCDLKNNLTNSATSVYFHKKQYKHKSINIHETSNETTT
jgi:hypothetical protein